MTTEKCNANSKLVRLIAVSNEPLRLHWAIWILRWVPLGSTLCPVYPRDCRGRSFHFCASNSIKTRHNSSGGSMVPPFEAWHDVTPFLAEPNREEHHVTEADASTFASQTAAKRPKPINQEGKKRRKDVLRDVCLYQTSILAILNAIMISSQSPLQWTISTQNCRKWTFERRKHVPQI